MIRNEYNKVEYSYLGKLPYILQFEYKSNPRVSNFKSLQNLWLDYKSNKRMWISKLENNYDGTQKLLLLNSYHKDNTV